MHAAVEKHFALYFHSPLTLPCLIVPIIMPCMLPLERFRYSNNKKAPKFCHQAENFTVVIYMIED
jgi:hypothetical protein